MISPLLADQFLLVLLMKVRESEIGKDLTKDQVKTVVEALLWAQQKLESMRP